MKKILSIIMAAVLVLGVAALAENTSALDAFNALTGKQVQVGNPMKSNAEYLSDIMAGAYAAAPADVFTATEMARELEYLTCISNRDIAAFASANRYPVVQVRNAYYIALANCLRAEIMINPASEDQYRNVQTILSLFLEQDEAKIDHASRESIRSGMTRAAAASIAAGYNLPTDFVEFVIMNDNWDDDRWDNDNDWRDEVHWADDDIYEDSIDDLELGDRDSAKSTRVAELQEFLIALGYLTGKADGVFGPMTQAALLQYQIANGKPASGSFGRDDMDDLIDEDVVARWDYEDSFDYDDSPEVQDSPDNSPDYDDSPEVQDSPDNSPDYDDSPDAPAATKKPAATKAPVAQDSPDDSPDYDDSPDAPAATKKPAATKAPVAQDSPDDSPDYDDSPEADDSPDYEDS